MKSVIVLLYMFLFVGELFCQNLCNYRFYALTNEDGLTQNTISCILKDDKGYIWAGTQKGLNRWDGIEFEVWYHDPDDSFSLAGDEIHCLSLSKSGNIWIGTDGGISIFDQDKLIFINKQLLLNNSPVTSIRDILFENNNKIWIGSTGKGLFLCDSNLQILRRYTKSNYSLSSDNVYCLLLDNKNRIWVGTRGDLTRIEKDSIIRIYRSDPTNPNSLQDWQVKCLYQDSDNTIYAGTWRGGISVYRDEYDDFISFSNILNPGDSLLDSQIESITEDDQKNLWIGTWNGGLYSYNKITKNLKAYLNNPLDPFSIHSNTIWPLLFDECGNLWIGSAGGGLNRLYLKPKKFQILKKNPSEEFSLIEDHALSVFYDSDDVLWVGSPSQGVSFVDFKNKKTAYLNMDDGLISNRIYSIYNQNCQCVYLGTNKGLNLYNLETKKNRIIFLENNPDFRGNVIYSMKEDKKGTIWLGTANGLFQYNPQTEFQKGYYNTVSNSNILPDNTIMSLLFDSEENLWLGSFNGICLFSIETGKCEEFKCDHSDWISAVPSLNLTKKGEILIGSWSGAYIFNKKEGQIHKIQSKEYLKNEMVFSIIEDENEDIWITSNKGLYQYKRNSGNEEIIRFDYQDGLPGNEFEVNVGCKNSNGNLFFGGPDGVVFFHPDSIKLDSAEYPVLITGFELFNWQENNRFKIKKYGKELNENGKLKLNYNENSFFISFTTLNYHLPDKNLFKYRLIGFDSTWKYTQKSNRKAAFTNLDNGEYIFQLAAANHDGVWNSKLKEVIIIIHPPFWDTLWFKLILFISIIAFIITIHKIRTVQIKKKNLFLKKHNLELNREIRERVKIEKALKESEYRYRLLFQKSADPVILYNRKDFSIRTCNVKALELYGYDQVSLYKKKFTDLFEFPSEFTKWFDESLNKIVFYKHRISNGKTITVTINTSILEFHGDTICLSVIRDETERLENEKEMNKLRKYLKNIIDSMPSILIGLDSEGRITQWNIKAEKETGLLENDVIGKNIKKVFPRLADDLKEIKQTIFEKDFYINHKIIEKPGNVLKYEDVTVYPLISNGVQGIVLKVDDITERVKLEEMLVQSEKMMSLGGLAAGMAHEINNPLTTVLQSAELVLLRLSDKKPGNIESALTKDIDFYQLMEYLGEKKIFKLIDNIIISAKRASKIVNNMLAFSRDHRAKHTKHSVNELIESTIDLVNNDYDLLKTHILEKIEFKKNYNMNIPSIFCEPSELQQVFFNIMKNSIQAFSNEIHHHPVLKIFTTLVDNMIKISFVDNGPGIATEHVKSLFEPFFTTKESGVGTGLGLFVSYFIITRNHQGSILVDENYRDGAKFDIFLPVNNELS